MSVTQKPRLLLCDKAPHAPREILRQGARGESVLFGLQLFREVAVEGFVDEALGAPKRDGRAVGQFQRHGLRGSRQFGLRHHSIDEAELNDLGSE